MGPEQASAQRGKHSHFGASFQESRSSLPRFGVLPTALICSMYLAEVRFTGESLPFIPQR